MSSIKKISSVGLILVFALLSGAAAYFGTKTIILQGKLNQTGSATPVTATPGLIANSTPQANPSFTAIATPGSTPLASTPDVVAQDRLSQPAPIYTVVAGDTLYPIGLKLKVDWQKLAVLNSLVEPYVLRIGQVLVVPTLDATNKTYAVTYTFDTTRAQTLQTQVNQGQNTWRTDPIATAAAELGGVYGLTKTDDYRLVSRDNNAGTAVVSASHLNGTAVATYEIHLRQPIIQGPTGLWTLVSLSVKK